MKQNGINKQNVEHYSTLNLAEESKTIGSKNRKKKNNRFA